MKYIMLEYDDPMMPGRIAQHPILFPRILVHEDVYRGVSRDLGPGVFATVVSGGFISYVNNELLVFGKSETLNVTSRDEDKGIIESYLSGLSGTLYKPEPVNSDDTTKLENMGG